MILKNGCHEAAACALYEEMRQRVPYSSCCKITKYVNGLPTEMPMGMSERSWEKLLTRQTREHAVSVGILSGGILMWIFQAAVMQAIRTIVAHWINNHGWLSHE
jgi:hypothetical protein